MNKAQGKLETALFGGDTSSLAMATPIGTIGVIERDNAIVHLAWAGESWGSVTPTLTEAEAQMQAYFAGKLHSFDLPLAPSGSPFQQQVYQAMREIPLGETKTYGEIAAALGVPAQPVGQACGANPIPIIIPCHRVLAANGLGGFSGQGGVEMKIALLKLENAFPYLI